MSSFGSAVLDKVARWPGSVKGSRGDWYCCGRREWHNLYKSRHGELSLSSRYRRSHLAISVNNKLQKFRRSFPVMVCACFLTSPNISPSIPNQSR